MIHRTLGGALKRALPRLWGKIIPELTVLWSNRLTEIKGQPPKDHTVPSNASPEKGHTPEKAQEELQGHRNTQHTRRQNSQCLAFKQKLPSMQGSRETWPMMRRKLSTRTQK